MIRTAHSYNMLLIWACTFGGAWQN